MKVSTFRVTLGVLLSFMVVGILVVLYQTLERKKERAEINYGMNKEMYIPSEFIYEHVELSEIDDVEVQEEQLPTMEFYTYGGKQYAVDDNGIFHDREGRRWEAITVTTTAYTWADDGVDPSIGAGDGKTSINKDARRTYGIASGSPMVPIGSVIHVAGYGTFPVDDTGGALRRAWTQDKEIVLDLRIPELRYDGVWRSVPAIKAIALRHGRKQDRIVLMMID